MKTGNTLRAARNSLLCFFMALGAGFLVACGGGGGATSQEFPAYLFDSAVKGVEYSGPTGNGSTGNGGVFPASDGGMFEFSIGATTLGSVRVNSDWPYVTPADFDDVDEERVIAIARIMQGLDGNTPEDGISIHRSARTDTTNLFTRLASAGTDEIPVFSIGDEEYRIPSETVARTHFAATRNCLFSGGYVGSYRATVRATVAATDESPDEGKSYFVLDLFADEARRIDVSAVGATNTFEMFGSVDSIGVIGSTITLSPGNEFSFVTPRMVTGIYTTVDADTGVTIEAGTNSYTFVAGNPRATRRIAGFETETAGGTTAVTAMYVLDHFARDGDFRGQYYDVQNDEALALSLTIASGSWPADAANLASDLVLSGTRGDENTTVTLKVIRDDDYYGKFESVVESGRMLSGTWCDIAGSAGRALYQLPATPTILSVDVRGGGTISVTWAAVPGATSYKLYRSTVSGGPYDDPVDDDISALFYEDTGLSESTEYYYRLEACNFDGCSERSSEEPAPAAGGGGNGGGAGAGAPPPPGTLTGVVVSDSGIDVNWSSVSSAMIYKLYRSEGDNTSYSQIGGDLAVRRYEDRDLSGSTRYYYQAEACNSNGCSERSVELDDTTFSTVPSDQVDVCEVGDMIVEGGDNSCTWRDEILFMVNSSGTASLGTVEYTGGTVNVTGGPIDGIRLTFRAVQRDDDGSGNAVWEILILG